MIKKGKISLIIHYLNNFKSLNDQSHSNSLGQCQDNGPGHDSDHGQSPTQENQHLALVSSMSPLATCQHCHKRDPRGGEKTVKLKGIGGTIKKVPTVTLPASYNQCVPFLFPVFAQQEKGQAEIILEWPLIWICQQTSTVPILMGGVSG